MPAVILADESQNYCLDPETNITWLRMLSESPHDSVIAELFALRIGLCELIERKIISIDRATDIFEESRQRGLKEKTDKLGPRNKEGIGV